MPTPTPVNPGDQPLALAVQQHRQGRLDEAEQLYRAILHTEPENPDALHLLGLIQHQRCNHAAAIEMIQHAIDRMPAVPAPNPRLAEAQSNMAAVLRAMKRLDDAERYAQLAIASHPQNAGALQNLGCILQDKGLTQQAIEYHQRALQLGASKPQALSNLGDALTSAGQFDQGRAALEQAVQLAPNFVEAHWNLALSLLLQGQWNRGFAEHEWRLRQPGSAIARFSQPMWNGEDLKGKAILLHMEQGYGDAIQFIRYAPLIHARGGRIILESFPPLSRLFAGVAGIDRIIDRGSSLPPFDVQCPLLSLPHIFRTTPGTALANVPYIQVDPNLIEHWHSQIAPAAGMRKIGLAWAGNPDHRNDRNRSIPLSDFAPLAQIPNTQFFALQLGPAATQTRPPGLNLIDVTPRIHDFADTAAILSNLDVLITVDTAIAHLAGALNGPTWLLLPAVPDWRWLLNADTSVWYPSFRLFRQCTDGDWNQVTERIAQSLRDLLSGH